MDLMQIILTIILGGISGILGGALGLGGSFIMLPGVILLNIIPNYWQPDFKSDNIYIDPSARQLKIY